MSNHVHLLLRTGCCPISSLMRRLLTGYAVSFNNRHGRHGHLFQNRYKSILCEEDCYLQPLIAYIHLNPIRAGIVEDTTALISFPYTGHSALMGRLRRPWQDTEYVIGLFGRNTSAARINLQRHLDKWLAKGRCPDLTGGGLLRSAGGWRAVKAAYKEGIRLTSDERILGSSEFAEKVLEREGERYERRMRLQSTGIDLDWVVAAVCRRLGIKEKDLAGSTKRTVIVQARALIGYIATRELLISGNEVARHLNQDRSAVSRAARRVEADDEMVATSQEIVQRSGAI